MPAHRHLVLYDGDCGLCTRVNQFILGRDRSGVFDFASLQSAIGREIVARFGRNPDVLTTFFVVHGYRGSAPSLLQKSDAALFVARQCGAPWSWAGALRIVPRVIRDAAYDLIARNRYRLFGTADVCTLPDPVTAARFIDGSARPLRREP